MSGWGICEPDNDGTTFEPSYHKGKQNASPAHTCIPEVFCTICMKEVALALKAALDGVQSRLLIDLHAGKCKRLFPGKNFTKPRVNDYCTPTTETFPHTQSFTSSVGDRL